MYKKHTSKKLEKIRKTPDFISKSGVIMVAGDGFLAGANCGKLSLSLPGVIKNPNIILLHRGLIATLQVLAPKAKN